MSAIDSALAILGLVLVVWFFAAGIIQMFIFGFETCELDLCKSDGFTGTKYINGLEYCTKGKQVQLSKPIIDSEKPDILSKTIDFLLLKQFDSKCEYAEVS